jgi:hypothetical protein
MSQLYIRYELKTPYRNGTTHMIFEPRDFISKLVALVPAPRVNLTRFHGVFAPHSKYRADIIKSASANNQSEKRYERKAKNTVGKLFLF